MSKLALLVVLLLALVGLLIMSAAFYLAYRHPKFAAPLMAAGTIGALFVAAVAVVGAQ
ncbi:MULTISPECIES: hypothetical protein [unclassified Streptomyces]|uniref:hypothetical protein n=1 Tax=unclassified Streptomyces TaxID=2593676 RepID=UPI0033A0AC06